MYTPTFHDYIPTSSENESFASYTKFDDGLKLLNLARQHNLLEDYINQLSALTQKFDRDELFVLKKRFNYEKIRKTLNSIPSCTDVIRINHVTFKSESLTQIQKIFMYLFSIFDTEILLKIDLDFQKYFMNVFDTIINLYLEDSCNNEILFYWSNIKYRFKDYLDDALDICESCFPSYVEFFENIHCKYCDEI